MSDNQISPKVKQILEDIETKERTYDQLHNLYVNIHDSDIITDFERESLIEVVEKKIKIEFPAKAKKQFGSKDNQAVIVLQEIYAKLDDEFGLSDKEKNMVKAGVKLGGDQMAGRLYVCRYFSFKTETKVNMGFAYNQKTVEDEPFLHVHERYVGQDKGEDKTFKVHEEEQAIEFYKNMLRRHGVTNLNYLGIE